MRDSVHEEVVAANRVAAQLLNRTVWRYAAQGTPAMLAFLQGMGRVRSNDITLFDDAGNELYRSPPSPYKAGRDAPAWFDALIAPPPLGAVDRVPGRQAGGARQCLARRARRLGRRADAGRCSALVLLLAVNALVFWLVGRTVRPFGQIVGALNAAGARAASTSRCRRCRARGRRHRRGLQPHGGRCCKAHIETERRAVRAELQLSDSRELTRWIDHHIEQERRPDRARAARRAGPVGDRDAQHGARRSRSACAGSTPQAEAGGAR